MNTPFDPTRHLASFASQISAERLGLVNHSPESGMLPTCCFANVELKIRRSGGRARFGWMFNYRVVADIPEPGYLIAIHHAVWNAPDGSLIDVTPFLTDAKHHPIAYGGSVLFLLDFAADPVRVAGQSAPLPSRFHAITSDARILDHVRQLAGAEDDACRRLYAGG